MQSYLDYSRKKGLIIYGIIRGNRPKSHEYIRKEALNIGRNTEEGVKTKKIGGEINYNYHTHE